MARFFRRLQVSKPVVRNNYFIQVVDPNAELAHIDPDQLGWSDSTNGPEDKFDQATKSPSADALDSGEVKEWEQPKPADNVENIRFRTERQTLRRLPRSGAIVFTIRTYMEKITDLGQEKGVPGRLASAIRSWGKDVAE